MGHNFKFRVGLLNWSLLASLLVGHLQPLHAHCHWRLRCKASQDSLCDVDYSKDNTIAYHSRLTSPCFERDEEGIYQMYCCEDKIQEAYY